MTDARRQLNGTKVADVMTRDPLVLRENMRLEPSLVLLVEHGYSGAPVVSVDGRVVGMLHALDVAVMHLPAVLEDPERHVLVGQVCRDAVTIGPDRTMRDAAATMQAHDTDRLVVVAGDHVVGLVTGHDLLRTLVRRGDLLAEIVDEQIARIGATGVRAAVDDSGVVLLTGNVESPALRDRLTEAIGGLDGVQEVDELLTIAGEPRAIIFVPGDHGR